MRDTDYEWGKMSHVQRCEYFLSHRVGAEKSLRGPTLDRAVHGWTPKIGRHLVSLGDTPKYHVYESREAAITAARVFKTKCEEWMKNQQAKAA